MFADKPQTSSWTSAHAQGYFSATILEYLAFDGFTRNRRIVWTERIRSIALFSEDLHAIQRSERNIVGRSLELSCEVCHCLLRQAADDIGPR
jgi:hypothetical protein